MNQLSIRYRRYRLLCFPFRISLFAEGPIVGEGNPLSRMWGGVFPILVTYVTRHLIDIS